MAKTADLGGDDSIAYELLQSATDGTDAYCYQLSLVTVRRRKRKQKEAVIM